MTENVSIILHWNTDYAEIPRKELPNVVKKSYEPMIKAIEEWQDGTICCNLTGHTFEFLTKNFPELIYRLKKLAKNNVIELLLTGYSHPILPLLPRERVDQQLSDHYKLLQQITNSKPKGCWPPELAISPSVLEQMKRMTIDWIAIDYEHFLLSGFFGNDNNPFEMRKPTITEILVKAFWSKGLKKLKAYLHAKNVLQKTNMEHIQPLRRIMINSEKTIKAYLSSVSWTNTTQFAVGGYVPIYNLKKHLKSILAMKTKILPLYASDIEFFGYRQMGPKPAEPKALILLLKELKKKGINTISPTQIPDEDWPKEPAYITSGSWAPDKSLRIWTDSEDNRELKRRSNEIYSILSSHKWDKKLTAKIEPYLRIMENSDPRGWAPLPERKNEAYSAIAKIFEVLEKT